MNSWVIDRMRHDVEGLAGAGLDVAEFCAAAGELVARAVPSATGATTAPTWYALDPRSLLITGVYGPECALDTAAQMRWEYLDEDVNKSVDVVRNPAGVQTLAEVTEGKPWLSPIYCDYMVEHDLAQEMLVALRGGDGQAWGTVRLNRPRSMAAFDEPDRQVMRSIAPSLAEGVRRGLLAGAPSDAPTPGAPGLVVVDRRGLPVATSATAREWLPLFPGGGGAGGDGAGGATHDGGLPLPVHAVAFAALAGAALAGPAPALAAPAPVLRVRLTNGQWAALHGVLTEPGTPETVGVIIGPAGREHLAPLTEAIYGLTAREQEVADLVLRGHATRQMAHRLGVSAFTVQEHLRHIFAKVGVASRGELAAALLLERSW